MEHPSVNVATIKKDMSMEDIQGKIRDITSRLGFAHQIQNQELINQLNMVLESYTRAQTELLDEMFSGSGHGDQSDKIDIS